MFPTSAHFNVIPKNVTEHEFIGTMRMRRARADFTSWLGLLVAGEYAVSLSDASTDTNVHTIQLPSTRRRLCRLMHDLDCLKTEVTVRVQATREEEVELVDEMLEIELLLN